jgi:hypothetical protein
MREHEPDGRDERGRGEERRRGPRRIVVAILAVFTIVHTE